tara:strand:- start:150 stop:1166 length:1017 start_codon:yes stop_codon:yes gene_type:complete
VLTANYNLQPFNTLGISAQAEFFTAVDNLQSLLNVISIAREKTLPLLLLGGGSNIVLTDDFPGIAIKLNLMGRELVKETDEFVWLRAGAGENWHELVNYCLSHHYWGLENLSLIPGCAGAAPIQNIGAYGVELKDVFCELEAVQISTGDKVVFDKDACQFGYRDSIFKGRFKDQFIITSITLKLCKTPRYSIAYPALATALKAIPEALLTPVDVSTAVCAIRRSKLPAVEEIPNAGSFFKNPLVSHKLYSTLQRSHPTMPAYDQGPIGVKLAAGWLIEQAGWKGKGLGGVLMHQHQALVLTNPKRASGTAVLKLAQAVCSSVVERFGIELEIEPRVYP